MIFLIEKGLPPKRAFKIMEAVRKGRGLPDGAEDEMRDAGVPEWYIESCKKIAYLFPKAHAVAYVMMAFRIAWFKVHRPLAFYAAYFSIRAKAFDEAYMCRGMEVCQQKMRQIIAKDKEATAVEQDMLTTLEVCYEFYLRGFTFKRMDIYESELNDPPKMVYRSTKAINIMTMFYITLKKLKKEKFFLQCIPSITLRKWKKKEGQGNANK